MSLSSRDIAIRDRSIHSTRGTENQSIHLADYVTKHLPALSKPVFIVQMNLWMKAYTKWGKAEIRS
jgi:hypothetical protein